MKKEILLNSVKAIAHINHIISSLESIGLQVEDDAFDGHLYSALDIIVTTIANTIGFGDLSYFISEHSDTYQCLIGITEEDIDSVYKKLLCIKKEYE